VEPEVSPRWFIPRTPDVIGLLDRQAETTVAGMEAFVAWSSGRPESAQDVRAKEHEADDIRRSLQTSLRQAFTLPLEAEDIYEMSERLDAVLNGAKNAVREAEVMGLAPDAALVTMARSSAEGVRRLRAAFAAMTVNPNEATAEADAAIACQRAVERTYRKAMSVLLGTDDLKELMGRRELYRRYARIGDGIVRVAERVWYAMVKES
jgi:uncharacterized protein Yka (UPF0111/DUF47 family)